MHRANVSKSELVGAFPGQASVHPPSPFVSSSQALPPSAEFIFQAYQDAEFVYEQDVHEASTSSIPQLPISPERLNTPSASPPMTPTHIPTRAPPPGTPLSRQRQESLRQEEQHGREIIEDFRARTPLDILEDDDWDVPEEQDDEDEVEDNHSGARAAREREPEMHPAASSDDHMTHSSTCPQADTDHEGVQRAGAEPNSTPIAVGVPAHKRQENTPDPFRSTTKHARRSPPMPEDIHPLPGIFLIYMLIAWLHLQFHLPFRACNAALTVFGLIIRAFGVAVDPPVLSTLGAVLLTMQLEPEFQVLPVCPNCLEVYPLQADGPTICSRCNSFIYKATPANAPRNANNPPTPLLRFPYKTIESQLIDILAVPGVEAELDKWRTRTRTPGKYSDIFDGDIPKKLKDHDGLPFFRNTINSVVKGPDGELRIGLTLGVDWYVRLSYLHQYFEFNWHLGSLICAVRSHHHIVRPLCLLI